MRFCCSTSISGERINFAKTILNYSEHIFSWVTNTESIRLANLIQKATGLIIPGNVTGMLILFSGYIKG
jgi:hypothetical protein